MFDCEHEHGEQPAEGDDTHLRVQALDFTITASEHHIDEVGRPVAIVELAEKFLAFLKGAAR